MRKTKSFAGQFAQAFRGFCTTGVAGHEHEVTGGSASLTLRLPHETSLASARREAPRGMRMRNMKKLIGVALAAGATVMSAGAANAEVSGSVALVSDYVFRGISQTDGGAAIQGSLDWSNDTFYAGVWGSNVNYGASNPTELASMELDAYVEIGRASCRERVESSG